MRRPKSQRERMPLRLLSKILPLGHWWQCPFWLWPQIRIVQKLVVMAHLEVLLGPFAPTLAARFLACIASHSADGAKCIRPPYSDTGSCLRPFRCASAPTRPNGAFSISGARLTPSLIAQAKCDTQSLSPAESPNGCVDVRFSCLVFDRVRMRHWMSSTSCA